MRAQAEQHVQHLTSGYSHLLKGFSLIMHPKLRAFVLVPLLVNLVLFGSLFFWLLSQADIWVVQGQDWLPQWLDWLAFIIWPLVIITFLLIGVFGFTMITNLIAAPFNGLLAERAEKILTGQPLLADIAWWKLVPRTIMRELQKIRFYLPRALACLIVSVIPGVGQLCGPAAWFTLNSWMMGLQYADYAFDNNQVSFPQMRQSLSTRRGSVFSFGAVYNLLAMLPLVNLLLIPVAVCGATSMWVEQWRGDYLLKHQAQDKQ